MQQNLTLKNYNLVVASRQLQFMTLVYATIITFLFTLLPYNKIGNYISIYFIFSIGVILVLLLFKDKIYSLVFLLLIVFVFEERPPTIDLFIASINNYSLWTFKIGPLNSVNYLIIFLICYSLFFNYLYLNQAIKIPKQVVLLISFVSCLIFFSFINGFIRGYEFGYILRGRDLQRDLYIIFGLVLSALFIRTRADLRKLMKWLLVILTTVLTIGLYRLILGIGMQWGTVLRLFLSATPLLLVFPISSLTTILCLRHYKNRLQKYFLVTTLLLTLFICFIQLGRTVWLAILFSIIFLLIFLPKNGRKVLFKYLVIFLLISIIILYLFDPNIFQGLYIRISSIFNWSISGYKGSFSNAVKSIEIINVFQGLLESNDIIWGKGYGSWWSHDYLSLPKMSKMDLASSYNPGETRHRSTHIHLLNRILKWGVLGTIIYVGLILALLIKATQRLKPVIKKDAVYAFVFGLIPVLIFTTIEISFARPFLIYGIMMGILYKTIGFIAEDITEGKKFGVQHLT